MLEASASGASSASVISGSKHRRGNQADPTHIVIPFSGKLVEALVDEGDNIEPGQVVCVIQQMKMELEVRSRYGGRVKWVTEADDGDDVPEGSLAAQLDDIKRDAATVDRSSERMVREAVSKRCSLARYPNILFGQLAGEDDPSRPSHDGRFLK